MGISRFGKRYDEKIAAAKAAEDAERDAERERIANLTPVELAAERVSSAADDWEVTVKVGDALAKSLKVALVEVERKRSVATTSGDNGWMESNFIGGRQWATFAQVAHAFSLDRFGYDVEIRKVDSMSSPARLSGPRKYFFGDDVLARNSTSPKAYGDWLMKVAGAIYELISNPWFDRVPLGRLPGNFKPEAQPDIVREALEQMEHLGVQVLGLEERVRKDEEAEAIASIRRTLGEVQ